MGAVRVVGIVAGIAMTESRLGCRRFVELELEAYIELAGGVQAAACSLQLVNNAKVSAANSTNSLTFSSAQPSLQQTAFI